MILNLACSVVEHRKTKTVEITTKESNGAVSRTSGLWFIGFRRNKNDEPYKLHHFHFQTLCLAIALDGP